jgi:nuclear GTP-binding protein
MPAPTRVAADPTKLFTPEELALMPASMDRARLKAQAKKAKKRRAAAERTETELLGGFMDMEVDNAMYNESAPRLSGKKARLEKKAAVAKRAPAPAPVLNPEAQKEAEFAKFLSNMGGEYLPTCMQSPTDVHSRRLGRGTVDYRRLMTWCI